MVLCLSMTSDRASGKVIVVSCGWCMFESLRSLVLEIVEMSRLSGPCSSTNSVRVGWAVISNVPVGMASRSGLMGCVVKVVWRGSHPHWRCGGVGGTVLAVFFFGGVFVGFVVVDC